MNSVGRVAAAIAGRQPDRVPVDLHNFQPAAKASGLPMSEVFRDGDLLAEAMLVAWREFGHDMILLENGTACNAEACGVEVHYRDDTAPVTGAPFLKSLAEAANLEVPDPYTTFPMSEVLKATRILAREVGDKAWICARADQGPMDLAAQLRGISEFMMDLASGEADELVHALLDYARRVATRYAYALIECGGRSTSIGEPMAGPAMISPRHYRRYPWAHERRMVEELKEHDIILHLHICGDTGRITDDFVGTGAQVLEVDHKTDITRLKEMARGITCLLGNIDTNLLALGAVDDIDAACHDLLDICKPGGGFILGPGCAMAPSTPPENIHALVESAKKWGRYDSS
ncbi:MAG TPA: uroporphyrinogen decarboxylase family protein [Acidimicrobiales bacterium]|nr:uroporphyrinogen decarboxylase family protein [Acidimicrobiales bacterium]